MNRCQCKRCAADLPHTPFDPAGLEKLMDLLHPPVHPRAPRRLRSYDQKPTRATVTPLRKHGGRTRQPWEPRPARAA